MALAAWLRWLIAVALGLGIVSLGFVFLRGIAASRPKENIDPEDVEELDVFFVCTDCGTEFRVTRLGEVQVPRHCGEPMTVVRRARANPADN